MLNRAKLWKMLKILLKISQLFLLIGVVVFVCVYFKKEAPKILGIYAFLLLRPEIFMVLAYADGQNPFAIFLQVFAFTTFTTFATWYAITPIKNYLRWCFSEIIDFIQRKNKKHAEWGKTNLFQKTAVKIAKFKNWFNTSKERYERKAEKFLNWFLHKGRYAVMIPFALPVLPGMDTACVILAKVIKLPYALSIFLGINAVKIIVILTACVYAPDLYHWLVG